jgi:hypothetical protein
MVSGLVGRVASGLFWRVVNGLVNQGRSVGGGANTNFKFLK